MSKYQKCFIIPLSCFILCIFLGSILAFFSKSTVDKLITDENNSSLRAFNYILRNLNAKPVKEIFAVAVNDDKACVPSDSAPTRQYLPFGQFSGIRKGCTC
jgi:hypothetical protein